MAEGTPSALKADIGEPSVEAVPVDPGDRDRLAGVLARFGDDGDCPHSTPDAVAVRLAGGERSLADVVRALDSEGVAVEHLQLHAPSLDDVFLAKTGRSLEGEGDGAEEDVAEAPAA